MAKRKGFESCLKRDFPKYTSFRAHHYNRLALLAVFLVGALAIGAMIGNDEPNRAGLGHDVASSAAGDGSGCFDEDGGRDYYKGGACSMVLGQASALDADYCIDDTIVHECYCEGNEMRSSEKTCEGRCDEGACIENASQDTNLFSDNAYFTYERSQRGESEEVRFSQSSSNNIRIEFTNKNGFTYQADVFGKTAIGRYELGRWAGSSLKRLVWNETDGIAKNEYFVVNKNNYSRIMQFKSVDPGRSAQDDNGAIRVKDLGSGEIFSVNYSGLAGDLEVDRNTYKFALTSDEPTAWLYVDFNGDGDLADSRVWPELWTKGGLNVTLAPTGGMAYNAIGNIVVTTEGEEGQDRAIINLRYLR